MTGPNRLRLDGGALVDNWRALARMSGTAACGAAVKADGYGLGAREVVQRLAGAGCRDFFVATWAEAAALADFGVSFSVLHGVRDDDMTFAAQQFARPVLNTAAQVRRWREAGVGACDVMVDTGMNRLGVSPEEIGNGLLDGLEVETLMSHLACADEASPVNERQRLAMTALAGRTNARRLSLANSAGIALGKDYAFDLTRPGLALYGGVPCDALAGVIRPVVTVEAEVLQRRRVPAGQQVGYNLTWTAARDSDVVIVNLGYADGYKRAFSNAGAAYAGDRALPVIGRVSMDLTALDATSVDVGEGDWIAFDADLPHASAASRVSQYELLTGLGRRFDRVWR
ncbi:alanine racemase [Sphingomonas jeddahensis]|uniref:Alanine racemase n=1 Tax=Sphingomonas jeddahensis TaxID=1915074 RepID=A0A1V2EZ21_9SPHN|nr:alanine racemase [Sphingomonas jeddahensis]ONF97725.1 Alanine racemase [Sphingomonas jeddahensis]